MASHHFIMLSAGPIVQIELLCISVITVVNMPKGFFVQRTYTGILTVLTVELWLEKGLPQSCLLNKHLLKFNIMEG